MTYDEGESFNIKEPTEYNKEDLERLQQEFDRINSIENPVERAEAVEQLIAELNGEV